MDGYLTLDDPLAAYDTITAEVGALAGTVTARRMDDPTPCAGWTVRRLLCHLAFVGDRYATLAEGAPPPEDEPDYPDPVAAFGEHAARARAAFGRPGYLTEVAPTPIGPQPGAVTVQHVVNELTVHGWDLARALGVSTDLSPELAARVLTSWRSFLEGLPRDGGPFGPERAAPAGATEADRLAAYLGRDAG
ncbi:TIGR03086 family metal-binding protein [Catellatospora chokoriensis]|uniref:TIGR03086 family protein n=1 Tax=Catellatospora chokoriensis TaxID=310353 RepID=A0A8J3NRG9_9ACTN|nr:TIGR03086 family metal-binding protein [Catellatospora chokoriensis]GIF89935.1 TIGR03086 family protein [Catellatospora chokoriensis]